MIKQRIKIISIKKTNQFHIIDKKIEEEKDVAILHWILPR